MCIAWSPRLHTGECGLRDYGIEPEIWDAEDGCEHVWGEHSRKGYSKGQGYENLEWQTGGQKDIPHTTEVLSQFCQRCNAWRGTLGLEPNPDLYVSHMLQIFREVRRVLHPSGTVWLNLGDSYSGSWGNYATGGIKGVQREQTEQGERWGRPAYQDNTFRPPTSNSNTGLKPKDLIGIPWRVALALQADGWWLRSDIIWAKPNPMPESVHGQAHEGARVPVPADQEPEVFL